MKRVVVTGGTGFVGACLTRRLVADGHEVHLLVRPDHDAWRLSDVAADLRVHSLRLEDPGAVRAALGTARPDWIFHLAVHGAYAHQIARDAIVQTNICGTSALLDAAVLQGFEAFVNAGSSSEYGACESPTRESDPLEPNSFYAVTKASATMLCRWVARTTGTQIPTLRLYSVYGPFEEPTRLLPRLLLAARENRLPPLANPEIARDFVYVDDVVEAFLAAARTPLDERGAIFNICSGVQTTLRELVEACRTEFGVTAVPDWGTFPARAWDTTSWVGDPGKAAKQLRWAATTDVRTGARAFFDWLSERHDLLPRYGGRGAGGAPAA